MRKNWIWTAIIALIIGVASVCFSLYEYYHIQHAGLENSSFCAINSVINCDIVNASSYATLFGIPVAAWGGIFYVVILGYLLFMLISGEPKESSLSFISAMSVLGLLWTLRMAYVSFFILNTVCLSCLAEYIVNILLVVSLYFASRLTFKERIKELFSKKLTGNIVLVLVIFTVGYFFSSSVSANSKRGLTEEIIDGEIATHFQQSLNDLPAEVLADSPVWGNKNAKVTIVEFSDFECPFCRVAAFNIKPYLYEFKNKVKFVFMQYPLDNSCNKYIERPMHQNACLAAKASVCANKNGKFWEYHDDIFKNQRKINRENLLTLAEKHGFNKSEFEKCIDSEETLEKIKRDIEAGNHIHVSGTPSVFINERPIRGWRFPEILRGIVREEIKRSK